MKFFKNLGTLVHTFIFIILGVIMIAVSLNLLSPDMVNDALDYVYRDPNLKLALGIVGIVFVLVGFIIANVNMGKTQAADTIAFENPEGQVTVSLSAIEDFVKKSIEHLAEVRDFKSKVTAGKKGISVACRATILADSNIPEITEKLQNIVKTKVHEMLGVEEAINIKIHVTKISTKGSRGEGHGSVKDHDEPSRRMPFGE